jgi:hypothetical protein
MNREFVTSNYAKIVYYLLLILFSGSVVLLFSISRNMAQPGPVYLFAILMMSLPVIIAAGFIRRKIIISNDTIKCISLFSTREFATSSIKGYRIITNKSSRSIVFELSDGAGKVTLSNVTDLADKDELLNWVQTNFTDLDGADMQTEKDELLQNTELKNMGSG